MEELLKEILSVLKSIDFTLDRIQGVGLYNSIADVCDKLDDIINELDKIQGPLGYNLQDIYNELS